MSNSVAAVWIGTNYVAFAALVSISNHRVPDSRSEPPVDNESANSTLWGVRPFNTSGSWRDEGGLDNRFTTATSSSPATARARSAARRRFEFTGLP